MANEKVLRTRILQKYDSLSAWNSSAIELKKGEIAFAAVDTITHDAHGNIVNVPTVLLKVGNGATGDAGKFANLPFVSALAADVYSWAKQDPATFIKNFLAMSDGSQENPLTMRNILDAVFATDKELENAISELGTTLRGELTKALESYYTKTQIDEMLAAIRKDIADLDVGVLEGRVDAVETAVNTTLPGEISKVDAKFADYTKTSELDAKIDELGYAKVAELPTKVSDLENDVPYLVAADIAGKADSEQVAKDIAAAIAAENLGQYAKASDVETALEGKVDVESYNADKALLATKEELTNGLAAKVDVEDYNAEKATFAIKTEVETALAGKVDNSTYTTDKGNLETAIAGKVDNSTYETDKGELEDAIDLKADAADVYTKDEADAKFADAEEYAATKALVDNFFDENGGAENVRDTLVEIIEYITADEAGAIELAKGVAAAKADAEAAVSTANTASGVASEAKEAANGANTTAGEAKELASQAVATANEAKTGAANSAAAADASAQAAAVAQGAAETAQGKAEDAQEAAEAAQEAAEAAKGEAGRQAQAAAASAAAALASQQAAATSAKEASDAKAAALVSAQSAGASEANAAASEQAAGEAKAAAEAAFNDATTAKIDAVVAQGAAEAAQGKAEDAQGAAEAAQGKAETARDEAVAAKEAAEASNTSATAIANDAKAKAEAAEAASNAATEAVAGLHEIAKTGSIYDIAEGANANTGADKEEYPFYLIFDCGSSTEVI